MSVVNEPACYLLIRKNEKLVFIMRQHTGYMDGYYSLPAGHVEVGETYSAGALREAFEEVGALVRHDAIRHVFTMHRFAREGHPQYWTDIFFETNEWSGELSNNEPDKHSELVWLSVTDLPNNTMDYQRYALSEIAKGNMYGEFGWSD